MDSSKVFEKETVKTSILKMCIPVIISMLVVVAYNMVDLFFVSMTGDSCQVAAVSLSSPVFMLLMAVGSLAGGGGTVAIARSLGAKESGKAKAYSSLCAWSMVIIGLVLTAFILLKTDFILSFLGTDETTYSFTGDYIRILGAGSVFIIFSSGYANLIRSEGAVKTAVISNLISTVINLICDPLFILLLDWGVKGAAMATVLGNIFGCLYLVIYVYRKSSLSISIKDIHLSAKEGFQMFCLGFPNSAGNLVGSVNNTVQNQILMAYGSSAIAAFGVASKVMMIISMICLGVAMGVQPLLAYNIGAGNSQRVKQILKTSNILALGITVISAVFTIVFRYQLAGIFFSQPEILEQVNSIVLIQMISTPLYGFIYIFTSYLQSCGKSAQSTLLSVARQGWILIPCSIIMNHIWGIYGFYFSSVAADILTVALCLILLLRTKGKRMPAEFSLNKA